MNGDFRVFIAGAGGYERMLVDVQRRWCLPIESARMAVA